MADRLSLLTLAVTVLLFSLSNAKIQSNSSESNSSDSNEEPIEVKIGSVLKATEMGLHYNFSQEFLDCGHIFFEPHEFELFDNGTVYIDTYHKSYGPRDYYLMEHGVYVCLPQFEEIKKPNEEPIEVKIREKFETCNNFIVEKEYVLLENGSLLLPSSDSIYAYETYFVQNDTAFLCADDEPVLKATEMGPHYNFSQEFLDCGHILIEPHEFELFDNGTVYIDIYHKSYGPRDYFLIEHGVYVCLPQFEEIKKNLSHKYNLAGHLNKFPESLAYTTYAGLTLSIISLLSHLVVFCVVSSVRNLPGYCLASLSLSLLIAYSCFLAIELVQMTDHCANLGMCIYYFFLTSFFWMNAIAFDIWRSFRVVIRELRISSHRVPWRRFLFYSLYSWLVPGALVVLVKVSDSIDLLPADFKPSFGAPICWFGQRKALLIFFAVPLCIVMLLNAGFFLDVTYVISRATLKTSQSHERTLKKRFFMFMRLALIMGLTWIVGLVAGYADIVYLWFLFVVLNTLQGLFIFIVFSCSSKVRNFCLKKYKKHTKSRGSTSVRTISQFSAGI